ncbi:DNA polymerase III subunit gamma/tau [Candidatus Providencia siddallii]|uniref:DNA polymerase III subunit gamma/tau n=1 Tax=Candidatus Providencia siddallii TaxID=1715285 RepID=A0ABP1CDB5_9GAMM
MNYQVLALKWRPKNFKEIVGQEHVSSAIINAFEQMRFHNGYIFSGMRGVGKTTISRIFVKGLNCINGITSNPCSKCINCLEIDQGSFADFIEVDAASRTKIEDIRELLENVQYTPIKGRFKIYLIDEIHMLSRHSFNALLKTLEEPPKHVKFLFATTEPQKVPLTILSRCLKFNLKSLSIKQISNKIKLILNNENIEYDKNAIQLIASSADGSMRDALSFTDQAIILGQKKITYSIVTEMFGTINDDYSIIIIEALFRSDSFVIMEQIEQVYSRGFDLDNLLLKILSQLHYISIMKLSSFDENDNLSTEWRLKQIAKNVLLEDLQLFYQILLLGRKELIYAPDVKIGIEMIFLRALNFFSKKSIKKN